MSKNRNDQEGNTMKTLLLGALGILVFSSIAMGNSQPNTAGKLGKACGGCHAIPPGAGHGDGRFKPGSHVEHNKFSCDRCHLTGISDTTEEHVDGKVSLRPEIEYQYGAEVPWPSLGSGSCGGFGYPYLLAGCHEQMPNATCFWVPGKKCQSP